MQFKRYHFFAAIFLLREKENEEIKQMKLKVVDAQSKKELSYLVEETLLQTIGCAISNVVS